MLNVYNKFINPSELDNYNNNYQVFAAVESLLDNMYGVTEDEKEILRQNTNLFYKDPEVAYSYALVVLKNRFKQAEPYIMKKPWFAYLYAKFILQKRWKEAEPYIKQDEEEWYTYSDYFEID